MNLRYPGSEAHCGRLREQMAAAALTGLLAGYYELAHTDSLEQEAWAIADRMLVAGGYTCAPSTDDAVDLGGLPADEQPTIRQKA